VRLLEREVMEREEIPLHGFGDRLGARRHVAGTGALAGDLRGVVDRDVGQVLVDDVVARPQMSYRKNARGS
jgi:hypothetical protein